MQHRRLHRLALRLLLGCAALPAQAAPAPAGAGAGITRKLLEERPVEGLNGMKTQLWRIDYAPGASAPLHHHPVVGIGYVVSGAFDSAFGDQALTRVSAGQSFVDPAQVEHRVFRNASGERPLTFLVAYTIPEGTPIVELAAAPRAHLQAAPTALRLLAPALYPETLDINPINQRFLVSSLRQGGVFEIARDGSARRLIDDTRLSSTLGIAVDARSRRLLVTNSDLGASVRPSTKGPKREAGVGIYDLSSGKRLHYADLTPLVPDAEHLINGIAVDAQGNAYATDSLAPAIYAIDPAGTPSLWLTDPEFRGPGVNLNGIVAHPDGFLIAVKKSSGSLYRIPLADPRGFQRIQLPRDFVGGDGLLLLGKEQLLLVANKTPSASLESAFVLESSDGWRSARVAQTLPLGSNYPTTCAALDGKLYALSSHLDEWLGVSSAERDALARRGRQAEILEIGKLDR